MFGGNSGEKKRMSFFDSYRQHVSRPTLTSSSD
jgi:hypothetical protein